jgi:hypothetical protein
MARTRSAFRTIVTCLAAALFIVGEPVNAAEIEVLGTKLTIGMSKAQTFGPFSSYRVQCLGGAGLPPECDSWLIQSSKPPFTPFANLSFKDGRLRGVWKYWERGFEGTDPAKFVATLHAMLTQYAAGGPSQMMLKTIEEKQGGATQTAIFLSKGNKTVVIATLEGARGADGKPTAKTVMLYETIE